MVSRKISQGKRLGPINVWAAVTFVPLLFGIFAGAQQNEPSAERDARIDRLIQQLDDEKFEVREKAEAELAAIGEAALPKLLVALKDSAAERKERAEKLVRRIRELDSGLEYRSA